MPNIVLTRIDNRLVHGQIATQWCRFTGANMILVVNDETAHKPLRQGLMDMAVPSYVTMCYWTIEKACTDIHKITDKKKILIVCENPQDVLKLVEKGVPISNVNIGNIHMSEGKCQVAKAVALDDEEILALKKMYELGVELEIRRVPSEEAEDIDQFLKK